MVSCLLYVFFSRFSFCVSVSSFLSRLLSRFCLVFSPSLRSCLASRSSSVSVPLLWLRRSSCVVSLLGVVSFLRVASSFFASRFSLSVSDFAWDCEFLKHWIFAHYILIYFKQLKFRKFGNLRNTWEVENTKVLEFRIMEICRICSPLTPDQPPLKGGRYVILECNANLKCNFEMPIINGNATSKYEFEMPLWNANLKYQFELPIWHATLKCNCVMPMWNAPLSCQF